MSLVRAMAGAAAALALLAALARAEPIDVAAGGPGVFPHLDASGRKSLAASGDWVALVWEDNRLGEPRCHLGLKTAGASSFRTFSLGRGECFEPGVSALPLHSHGVPFRATVLL